MLQNNKKKNDWLYCNIYVSNLLNAQIMYNQLNTICLKLKFIIIVLKIN